MSRPAPFGAVLDAVGVARVRIHEGRPDELSSFATAGEVDPAALFDALDRRGAFDRPGVGDFDVTLVGGRRRWFRVSMARDGEDRLVAWLDVTRFYQVTEDLESLARFPGEDPGPVLRARGDGVILYANPSSLAWLETWGVDRLPALVRQMVRASLRAGTVRSHHLAVGDRTFDVVISPVPHEGYANLYGRDITEAEAYARELRTTSLRLGTLLQHHPNGILLETWDRKVAATNPTFHEMFGIPVGPEALIGSDCASSASQSALLFANPEGFLRGVTDRLGEGAPVTGETLALADGRVFERDYVPLVLDGSGLGHLWQYRDVTLRSQAEADMARARQEAEASARQRSEWLAALSHEVRTPLNALLGMGELLGETSLDQPQRALLEALLRNGDALLSIVSGVLDISRLEHGNLHVADQPFELAGLCAAACESVALLAGRKGLELVLDVAEGVPETVRGDAPRVRQVLVNLLNNAVKYTDQGSVQLKVGAGPSGVVLVVEDTGPGIPEGDRQRVFDRFAQVQSRAIRGGAGLGLHIVQGLVQAMGGTVSLGEGPLGGTAATLTLPLPTVQGPGVIAGLRRGVAGESVVVAGDSGVTGIWLRSLLSRAGLRVVRPEEAAAARCRYAVFIDEPAEEDWLRRKLPEVQVVRLRRMSRREARPETKSGIGWDVRAVFSLSPAAPQRSEAATLHLPATEARILRALLGEASPSENLAVVPRGEAGRALLVEDQEDSRQVIAHHLGQAGWEVTAVETGEEALSEVERGRFDLGVVDLHLPGIDGPAVARAIRAGGRAFPLVALTAHATSEVRELARESGFDAFYTKPISREALVRCASAWGSPKIRLLVVDDAVELHRLVALSLAQTPGIEVAYATDLGEARERLGAQRFDVVWLDDQLPSGSGLELVPEIRAQRGSRATLWMVTGNEGPTPPGIDRRWLKPVPPQALRGALLQWRPAGPQGPGPARPDLGAASKPGAAPGARQGLLGLASTDVPPELVAMFLEDLDRDLGQADDLAQGGDLGTLARFGHRLKGSAGAYGFEDLGQLGARLERAAGAQDLEAARSAVSGIWAWRSERG